VRLGVLGTGVVGTTLATRFAELGHTVTLGARSAANETAVAWAAVHGQRNGTFADAAEDAELVVNATSGGATLQALTAAGAQRLAGKVLIDVANPLDFSGGFPPSLTVANTDSLGEQVQRAFPAAQVVKALNTVTAAVMARPQLLGAPHDLFVAGDDEAAKAVVRGLLAELGWEPERVHDLGGIEAARGSEMYLALWLRLMASLGTAEFNVRVIR
jgi:predicted dinucleotide-binding enzyme